MEEQHRPDEEMTDDELLALLRRAAEGGNVDLAKLANRALDGDAQARRECTERVREGRR